MTEHIPRFGFHHLLACFSITNGLARHVRYMFLSPVFLNAETRRQIRRQLARAAAAAVRVLRSGYSSVLPCTSVACAELLGSGLPAPVVPVPPCLPVLRLLPRSED